MNNVSTIANENTALAALARGTRATLTALPETDITARQMAVLLICYTSKDPQTVRGLAAELNLHKPSVTRSVDRLEEMGLLERRVDLSDRRSVLLTRTFEGTRLMTKISRALKGEDRSGVLPEAA